MALSTYKKKRNFRETPEPSGGESRGDELLFVVQKHQATRLHYDFRLEMKGALKSWAVPKGPSMNPEDKRLAVEVEDHPYDYKDFEGTIPKGNYGAGSVIIWDEGTYTSPEFYSSKKEMENALLKQWKDGRIEIHLKGHKLKGAFTLTRMKENNWLLIKHKDRFASSKDITLRDKSVRSDKTLEVRSSGRAARKKEEDSGEDTADSPAAQPGTLPQDILMKAPPATFPPVLSPMLASVADRMFDDPDWIYEVKWDGYRAVGGINKNKTLLLSRNGQSFEQRFYPVFNALKEWKINIVLDGEIVALNSKGLPDFNTLQNWHSEQDGELRYYIFDLLWLDGRDITGLPLYERKVLLDSVLPSGHPLLQASITAPGSATKFFRTISEAGLEGLMAKRADSRYRPGLRTRAWLKIKTRQRQEVVIAGYTRIEGTSRRFSSLLLGVFKNGELQYAGKVGTGFDDAEQIRLLTSFRPLESKVSPFNKIPKTYLKFSSRVQITWLKPGLVCEIYFTEVTSGGIFRHPVYIGLREDKDAASVKMEKQTRNTV